jgi:hypothetical protein
MSRKKQAVVEDDIIPTLPDDVVLHILSFHIINADTGDSAQEQNELFFMKLMSLFYGKFTYTKSVSLVFQNVILPLWHYCKYLPTNIKAIHTSASPLQNLSVVPDIENRISNVQSLQVTMYETIMSRQNSILLQAVNLTSLYLDLSSSRYDLLLLNNVKEIAHNIRFFYLRSRSHPEVITLLESMPNLKQFTFSCSVPLDDAMEQMDQFPLHKLIIDIPSYAQYNYIPTNMKALELHLSRTGEYFLTRFLQYAENFPNLRTLKLDGSYHSKYTITSTSLGAVSKLPHLQYLELENIDLKTRGLFKELVKNTTLKSLTVSKCYCPSDLNLMLSKSTFTLQMDEIEDETSSSNEMGERRSSRVQKRANNEEGASERPNKRNKK